MPLPDFIEHLYFKSFGKTGPDGVVSIEQRIKQIERKKIEKRERKSAEMSVGGLPNERE